jgi:ABC-type nitrate/sulfonate/bicarbonate transport system substrate-binding protein
MRSAERHLPLWAASLLAGVTLVACGRAAQAESLPTVKVSATRSVADSLVWGMERFAAAQGIRLEPVTAATFAETQQHLIQNAVDAAKLGYQNVAILADRGVPGIKVVAGATKGTQNLVARTGSGIERWPDLKGKKIGIVQGSYAAVQFLIAARLHGLDPAAIDLVHVTPVGTTEIKAMKDGQLDGYVIWSPTMERAILQGVAYRPRGIDTGDTAALRNGVGILAVGPKLLRDAPTLQKFLKAYAESVIYYRQHPDAWAQIAAQVTGADPKALELAVTQSVLLDYKLVRASLVGAAQYGPQFGYTKRDVSREVESYVDLEPLGRALGVDPQGLWE